MFHQYGLYGFHFFPFPIVLTLLLFISFLIARSYGYFGSDRSKQTEPPEPTQRNSEALEILKRRLAKGEIDEEEFGKRFQVLRQNL
ncbi:hypothetical protein GCM10007094_33090 [Pseudovibrio japonicus]|uniref:SHOCT domain-containing protein n=1 Tax=Pseudovibrio japonicus TaxID=366534 RepID=A0ABQ3EIE4_9HYPH|nr:SHOCT domain-containing protein [Pseudovibrio japonicus]GHB41031.1 hypothetical protein GCM10007094_33090 [Pseudovibrio japonicus]